MQRDARCYLWDALKAAEAVQAFMRGKTYETFIEDDLLRSAVERQLQIIGEALSQLAKVDPQIAGGVAELPRIIAFRNILVHGYAAIDYDTVWRLIVDKLPELQTNLTMLLRAADPAPDPSGG
ncbi:MAG: DUF86 domain-containing protein [Alphaproteobacteria bacterium]|nr:DUF86 domain-containing protein [Alphaproteobacteria bacterium]